MLDRLSKRYSTNKSFFLLSLKLLNFSSFQPKIILQLFFNVKGVTAHENEGTYSNLRIN